MQNISSEQELKQLLEEGRITEDEYKELLETLRQKEMVQELVEKPKESKPHTGYSPLGAAFGVHAFGGNVQNPKLKELFQSFMK